MRLPDFRHFGKTALITLATALGTRQTVGNQKAALERQLAVSIHSCIHSDNECRDTICGRMLLQCYLALAGAEICMQKIYASHTEDAFAAVTQLVAAIFMHF